MVVKKKLIIILFYFLIISVAIGWMIKNIQEQENLNVVVFSPKANEAISSPYKITGKARGTWFFEASFPVILRDKSGKELGIAVAQATSDWMTEDFVNFVAEIKFEPAGLKEGELIFKKDNPSGLPENDAEIVLPVRFK
ncbi:MAG TPA: Gmad2 immunoglobulin-like domain-containing protein [Candidatus Paceibacterota bacterium]|nr:Gmad2 immunoglobulin-like domain-containing protein [Candidatus Paceibacterota bacterium]